MQCNYVTGCMDVMLDYSEDGLLMRFFYPTRTSQNEKTKYVPWLDDDAYVEGMAKAIYIRPFVLYFLRWWFAGSKVYSPLRYGEKVNTDTKLKCIVLSHGFASTRFFNSVICNELASRGYLVVALEHRDNSAGYTYYYANKEDAKNDNRTALEIKRVELGVGHYETRNAQVNRRARECSKVLDFLINLNNGTVPYNVMDDLKGDHDFHLEDLVGKLDLDSVTMAGHSFGGATALLALSKRKEFRQGILLDPWMFPIKDEEGLVESVTQPLLFINTQTFHISSNVEAMKQLLTSEDRHMYTLLSTTHEYQSDSVLVFGSWLNWFMKKLDPHLALQLNNALALKFLKQYTNHPETIEDCEKLLEAEKTHVVSGVTKPWA
ncbi:hypothetical protein FQR65_LT05666 [Abscondita terminalis]|nr:hypothetical protein FQR65_LT05666 [Abscondita terminalis]